MPGAARRATCRSGGGYRRRHRRAPCCGCRGSTGGMRARTWPRPYGSGMELRALLGDITEADVDVVVNAANPGLLGGGGVDGAIHRAGGPDILAECRALKQRLPGGRLPRGEAVATTAGRLPARWVVHTAGPIWSASEDRSAVLGACYANSLRGAWGRRAAGWRARWVVHPAGPIWSASEDRSAVLRACYANSLRVADGLGARTVAFPAVSAGVYGWPLDDAARQAVSGVRSVEGEHVVEVRFVLFSPDALTAFQAVLAGGAATG